MSYNNTTITTPHNHVKNRRKDDRGKGQSIIDEFLNGLLPDKPCVGAQPGHSQSDQITITTEEAMHAPIVTPQKSIQQQMVEQIIQQKRIQQRMMHRAMTAPVPTQHAATIVQQAHNHHTLRRSRLQRFFRP